MKPRFSSRVYLQSPLRLLARIYRVVYHHERYRIKFWTSNSPHCMRDAVDWSNQPWSDNGHTYGSVHEQSCFPYVVHWKNDQNIKQQHQGQEQNLQLVSDHTVHKGCWRVGLHILTISDVWAWIRQWDLVNGVETLNIKIQFEMVVVRTVVHQVVLLLFTTSGHGFQLFVIGEAKASCSPCFLSPSLKSGGSLGVRNRRGVMKSFGRDAVFLFRVIHNQRVIEQVFHDLSHGQYFHLK